MASVPNIHPEHAWQARLRLWIGRHALLVFFVVMYAVSWTVWLVSRWWQRSIPQIGSWFGLLAPYGPTVAAVALAALLDPQRVQPHRSVAHLVILATVLAGALVVLWPDQHAVATSRHPLIAGVTWLLIALVPVWVVRNVRSPIRGVHALLSSFAAWRVHMIWYGVALLIMPLATLLGIGLLALLGQPVPALPRTEPLPERVPLLLTVFWGTLLYGGPLGEEAGWRGFALPRLQTRFSPLVASLILSVVWGVWHLPLHLNGFYAGTFPDGLAGIGLRLLSSLGLAIVFTWLYNRTRGNLLLMVLLHTAVNNTAGFWLPSTVGTYLMTAVFVVIIVSVDKMWLPFPAAPAASHADSAAAVP